MCPYLKKIFVILPAGFDDAGDYPAVGQFAEANPGHLELAEVATRSSGEDASISKTHRRRILWKAVQFILSLEPLLIANGQTTYNFLEFLPLGPFSVDHLFTANLLCYHCSCHGPLLFFTGRAFLPLLAIRIGFVNHIYAPFTTHNFVPFIGICFNGCFDFHCGFPINIKNRKYNQTVSFLSS